MAIKDIAETLEVLRIKGEVAAYSVTGPERKPVVQLWLIGKPQNRSGGLKEFLQREDIAIEIRKTQEVPYYFLGGELRPGTGIIRRACGRPEGPSGTLTCLLSSKFSQDLYFVAAGHVATDFWKIKPPDVDGSIYLSRPGFPGTNSMRSLGELLNSSEPPRDLHKDPERSKKEPDLDIAIVKLQGEFTLKQRTTCYGNFGELPSHPADSKERDLVMKCGAEETHWTTAVVETESEKSGDVYVYGPDNTVYVLRGQVILRSNEKPLQVPPAQRISPPARQRSKAAQREQTIAQSSEQPGELPDNDPGTPFAVSGDSGTMVVDRESQRPVGMLIAGSVLDGRYVMTPISAMVKYWKEYNLVLLRA